MSKAEIEAHLRATLSGGKTGKMKSFSERVDEEMNPKAPEEEQMEKSTDQEEQPQINEAEAQPSEGGSGEPVVDAEGKPVELDENGEPKPEVPEPTALTDDELNQDPKELLEAPESEVPEATEGEAEKPQSEIVKEMGAEEKVQDESEAPAKEAEGTLADGAAPAEEATPDPAPDAEIEKDKREQEKGQTDGK